MDFHQALTVAKTGLEAWKAKPHNARWWRRIDGTPIPNDLLVNIAEAFVVAGTTERLDLAREDQKPDREAIARIVDPEAWADADRFAGRPKPVSEGVYLPAGEWRQTQPSLSKADQILALSPPSPVHSMGEDKK